MVVKLSVLIIFLRLISNVTVIAEFQHAKRASKALLLRKIVTHQAEKIWL